MNLYLWAHKWGVPEAAVSELIDELTVPPPAIDAGMSEGAITKRLRLNAAGQGVILWRNNVGAMQDDNGNFVRYGLANDTKQMSDKVKSSDLIGIRPVRILPEMVGSLIGQFVAREVKAGNWKYRGNSREQAQLRFLELVTVKGGDAKFTNNEYDI